MAKTLAQIKQDIDTQIAADVNLGGLNATSATANFRLWRDLAANIHKLIFDYWEIVKMQLAAITSASIIGTPAWYVGLAKNWLYGGLAIVTNATIVEAGTKVILKVAKANVTGSVNLSATELGALRLYINGKKIAGTDIDILSQAADLIDITANIQYDINYSAATIVTAVNARIVTYLAGLIFNAPLSKSLMETDLINNVPGVINAYIQTLSVDIGLGYQPIAGNSIASNAGYFEVGKSSGIDRINLNLYV